MAARCSAAERAPTSRAAVAASYARWARPVWVALVWPPLRHSDTYVTAEVPESAGVVAYPVACADIAT